MRINLLFILLIAVITNSRAQDFSGFRTDNYNGVNGVFFNPANVVDSRYKFDVNIMGVSAMVGNDNISFGYGKMSDLFADSNFTGKLIGKDVKTNALLTASLHMPSVMINITPTTSLAFTSRSRIIFNMNEFDGNLVNMLSNELSEDPPYNINSSSNMRLGVNSFAEFGISVGQVLLNEGEHFIKGGLTLKYLMGVGNNYLQVKDLNATVDVDNANDKTYMTDASGRFVYGTGGVDIINNKGGEQAKLNNSGFGTDIGFIYEYRPGYLSESANKYKLKVSVAVLDLGSIKYKQSQGNSTAYDIHIPVGSRFYLDELNGESLSEFNKVLDAHPDFFTKTSDTKDNSYKVSLPTTIHIGADYLAYDNLYVALNGQISVVNNQSKVYNPQYYSSLTLTPRYETRSFAGYMPINYNGLTGLNIGLGLRAGPVFVGSSSAITGLFSSSKQADFYLGFRVGVKKKLNKNMKSKAGVVDTDGDGVEDADDKCPGLKGLKEYDGCPPPADTEDEGKEAE